MTAAKDLDGMSLSGKAPPSGKAAPVRHNSRASLVSATGPDLAINSLAANPSELLKPAPTVYMVRRAQDEKYANDLERFRMAPQSTEQRDAFQRFSIKEMADAVGTTPYLEEQRRMRDAMRQRVAKKCAKAAAKHGVAAPLLRVLAGTEGSNGRSSKPQRAASASSARPRSAGGGSVASSRRAAGVSMSGLAAEEARREERARQWHSGFTEYTATEPGLDAPSQAAEADQEEQDAAEPCQEAASLPLEGELRGSALLRVASTPAASSSRGQMAREQSAPSVREGRRSARSEVSRTSHRSSVGLSTFLAPEVAVAPPGATAPVPLARAPTPAASASGSLRPPSSCGGATAASKALHVLSSALDVPGNVQVAEALKVLERALGDGEPRPMSAASTRSASSSASVVSSRSAGSSAASLRSGVGQARDARTSGAFSSVSLGSRPPPSIATERHLEVALVPDGGTPAPSAIGRCRSASAAGSKARSSSAPTVRSAAYQPRLGSAH